MGRPYSPDLRLRVLAALDSGMSKMAAHQTFGVSRSTIDDWLRLREQTGGVQANTSYDRGRPPALPDTLVVRPFVQKHQHRTLEQMALAWQEEGGQRLSRMTFSTTLRRRGYTRKKELSLPRTRRCRTGGLGAADSQHCSGRACLSCLCG
jgi:transposase